MLITASRIDHAWARAFVEGYAARSQELSPLVVTIERFEDYPDDDATFRNLVNRSLRDHEKWTVETTASVIFPKSLWCPERPRQELYDRYLRILPRVQKFRMGRSFYPNRYGTYFGRMIAYGSCGINQLEFVLGLLDNPTFHRRSGFVLSIFDPAQDHKTTPYLGFPCLHQVCFAGEGSGGLSVTGFYAKQDLFERAYGNYVGLARLGHFVAAESGRRLRRITCVSATASGFATGNKTSHRALAAAAEGILQECDADD